MKNSDPPRFRKRTRVVSTSSSNPTDADAAEHNTPSAQVVTPPETEERHNGDEHEHGGPPTKRQLFDTIRVPSTPSYSQLPLTQTFPHSQDSTVAEYEREQEIPTTPFRLVEYESQIPFPIPGDESSSAILGRDAQSILNILPTSDEAPYISRKHCKLVYSDITQSFAITPLGGPVFLSVNGKWKEIKGEHRVDLNVPFRLVPFNAKRGNRRWDQYTLIRFSLPRTVGLKAGSESFDVQYLDLLRLLKRKGVKQENKKGENVTLSQPFSFAIELFHPEKLLLPTTTLRKIIGGGLHAVYEAIWYLRGENHVRFLQQLNCRFWDKQAGPHGFVGLSYGLLTNYRDGINQLHSNVIEPLRKGKCSRNMTVILSKPGEETVQNACTSSVQFALEPAPQQSSAERLNLTVNQRSSDVILGLPHDVIAWSAILHMVVLEVRKMTILEDRKKLCAGTLFFHIAAGGSHVYCKNEKDWEKLLHRQPKHNVEVDLSIQKKERNIFQFAQQFEKGDVLIHGYTEKGLHYHPHIKIQQAL